MRFINYKLLYDGDILSTDLRECVAINRNLPPDWCQRQFTKLPPFNFIGLQAASNMLSKHLKSEDQKIQIVVDSDLDGITSAAIMFKFLQEFYPEIECVYSLHTGKQHGLSPDIIIEDNTTLVILPDSGVNDVEQCKMLSDKGIDVICLDHHIIEQLNPYAAIVSCMDGEYSNQHLCGAAVTWLFLWGFCYNCVSFFDEHQSFLLSLLDLVAVATISDIMEVTNEDNMYFIQNGLSNIQSRVLCAFLSTSEVSLNDVTIEDIKFKVSPLISAMIRMGSMPEKTLLFRAFIDDYEEFDYEKRGGLGIETETIYYRVVRLCKNAKSRQDRAKQKLLDECQIYEYPHILLVEYQSDNGSTLTGLVANELANQYCKPCFIYNTNVERDKNGKAWFNGSVRNYDGSPISSIKDLLSSVFQNNGIFQGHAGACGGSILSPSPNDNAGYIADLIEGYIDSNVVTVDNSNKTHIGERIYNVDFSISANEIDAGFVQKLHWFERYSGYGFAPVTVLVTGIKVSSNNFQTMGKNSFNWKISDRETGINYIKFKIDRHTDELVQKLDDVEWDSENDYGKLYDNFDKGYTIDAICSFGLNVYKGTITPQAIVKNYMLTGIYTKETFDSFDDDDLDLDFDL